MFNEESLNLKKMISGFVKIWKVDPKTGETSLLVDQPNLVLRNGAKIITSTLAGLPNSKIWGMYVGYNNNSGFTTPTIDVDYSTTFPALAAGTDGFNYLREPLAFSPSFVSDSGYTDNIALFSVMISSANGVVSTPEFTNGVSKIYEIALIAAPSPGNLAGDIVFSRTSFNPIIYDSSVNFTITWGVKILVN